MNILEGLTIISFFAGVFIVAENIPLCALCFGVSFLCGLIYKLIWARGMRK